MLQPGDQIDIWVVERPLGSGGMGSVYRCHNRTATRILAAVKVLEGNFRQMAEAEARFIREAEILFSLDHPNIVKVRNVRTDLDTPYLEMEFVEGESLDDKLKRGPLPLDESIQLIVQMADAVAYLHRLGIRHRDIKPANVLIKPDGLAKLVDFGLAMEADHTRITQHGMTFGTVSYAPPEWVHPETLDPEKWDLYACGVVFYEMLTGKVAFPVSGTGSARQQAMQVILAKQSHPPLDPGPEFPPALRQLVADLTRSDASERVQSARDLLERAVALIPGGGGPTLMPTDGQAVQRQITASGSLPSPYPPTPRTPSRATPRPDSPNTFTMEQMPGEETPGGMLRDIERFESRRVTRRRTAAIVTTLVVVAAIVAATVSIGVAVVLYSNGLFQAEPGVRDVEIAFEDFPRDLPVDGRIRADGPDQELFSPIATADATLRFIDVPTGRPVLTWVAGGCAPDDAVPEWCLQSEQVLDLEPGDNGVLRLGISVAPPTPRQVVAKLDGGSADAAVAVRLGDSEGAVQEGQATFADLAPGPYRLVVSNGTCADSDDNCSAADSCPVGCGSAAYEVVVPWAGDAPVGIDVTVPSPREETPKPVRPPVVAGGTGTPDRPLPTPAGGTAGGRVTNGQFARFLEKNPDWSATAARGNGLADENYLIGWNGAAPPAGSANRPATNVSYYAAAAYCRTHGGLASASQAPSTWTDGAVVFEWRTDNARATVLSADGSAMGNTPAKSANGFTGFRCARP